MTAAADGLPTPRRYWAAFSVATSLVVYVMDASMVTVMLPVIAESLGVAPSQAIWAMTAYHLTLACLLLPLAALGEKYGQWLIYSAGLVLFSVGAIFSASSTTLATLIAGRVLQGVGAAGAQSMTMALLRHSYPRAQFGRAAGINSTVVGVSMASGPAVGAAILLLAEWRTLFLLVLPVAAFSLGVGLLALPRISRRTIRFDFVAAAMTSLAVLCFVLGLNELRAGADPLRLAGLLGLAIVITVLLVRRLRGTQDPVLPVDLLSVRIIALSLTTSLCLFTAQGMTMTALPFHLAQATGLSAGQVGLLITPWPFAMAIMANVSGWLSERYSARLLCACGIAIMVFGMTMMVFLPDRPTVFEVLWRMAVFGTGFGLFVTPNNRLVMLNAPLSRASAIGGLVAMVRMIGMSLGATLAAVMFSYWPHDPGHAAFTLAACVLVVAFILCCVRKTSREAA